MHACHRAAAPEGDAPRAVLALLLRDVRAGTFLVRCAWCHRYRVDGAWFEVPPSFARWCDVTDRPTTHGICPECLSAVSK